MAAIEMEATQRQNQRAKGDKTFHLLISFPTGEVPSPEVLHDIETTMCDGLGYGQHQRVSVVHTDTDNFHLHVAINKIHPSKLTLHEPFQFQRKLLKMCDMLEDRHGLKKDNHTPKKTRSENRAKDMERSAGVESLITWMRRECSATLADASTWNEFHAALAAHGLHVRERGAGLVFGTQDGVFTRASTVDRAFSRASLERRFGAFRPPDANAAAPAGKGYAKAPVQELRDDALWSQYLASQKQRDALGRQHRGDMHKRLQSGINKAALHWKLKRIFIRHALKGPLLKRVLYAQAKRTFEKRVTKLRRAHQRSLAASRPQFARQSWYQWLQDEAKAGNKAALARLKKTTPQVTLQSGLSVSHVTKDGAVSYRVGGGAVRDDGRRFILHAKADETAMRIAMIRTMQRSGPRLAVTGTEAFRNKMVEVAVASRLPLTFVDPTLEARRRAIVEALQHDRSNKPVNARSQRGGRSGPGRPDVADGRDGGQPGAGRVPTGERNPPVVARVGTRPPPDAKNRLRKLSALGVVRIAKGPEVLLSSHVPNNLGQQPTAGTDNVRRPDAGSGRGVTQAPPVAPPSTAPSPSLADAVDRYITERNAKRGTFTDIPEHRRHSTADVGPVQFAGIREVDGNPLALLRIASQIAVVPITRYAASRLKTTPLGSTVHLHRNGEVRLKPRSRSR
ncbi:relaxase/mobilization nuclease-like protein [Azospirillum brasilense]|nr:relaxase/mobilization nuclease-like protein [Azospirillum brasilense]